jgi:hypothetical protein
MSTRTKIFVTLAFIVAAFYLLEVALSIANGNIGTPIIIKSLIFLGCIVYGIKRVKGITKIQNG